jgi:acetyl esterase
MKNARALYTGLVVGAAVAAISPAPWALAAAGDKASAMAETAPMVPDPMKKADADMTKVLDALAALHPKPIETLTPAEARKQPSPADAVKAVMAKSGKPAADMPADMVTTKDITITGPGGANPARIYTPSTARDGKPLPVVVYYHGGGWVIADLDTYDATPRAIASMANAIVVSAEYRHAPEHKFPAAHDDAWVAYKWVLENAKSFGGDAGRVALLGESAGGNLAINVAIAARDMKQQMPVYEALIYPVAGVDMETPSYKENAAAKPLSKPAMAWFVKHTTNGPQDLQDPRLDLVGKAKLSGLPPTTIVTAEIDPLRSEGQALGKKLQQAGVTVKSRDYTGVTHEFFGMGSVVAKAKTAEMAVADDLKSAFAKSAPAKKTASSK